MLPGIYPKKKQNNRRNKSKATSADEVSLHYFRWFIVGFDYASPVNKRDRNEPDERGEGRRSSEEEPKVAQSTPGKRKQIDHAVGEHEGLMNDAGFWCEGTLNFATPSDPSTRLNDVHYKEGGTRKKQHETYHIHSILYLSNIIIYNTIPMAQVYTDFILPLYKFPFFLLFCSISFI